MRVVQSSLLGCSLGLILSTVPPIGSEVRAAGKDAPIVHLLQIPQPSQSSTATSGSAKATGPANGEAISYTEEQAKRGRAVYVTSCTECHGSELNNGEFGGAPLKGDQFRKKFFGTSIAALYGFISNTMPQNAPGQLTPQQYANVTAYILQANGVTPGPTELPPNINALSTMSVK